MALVTRILCQVLTKDVSGAGTDGSVYLGLGGREFRMDTTHDDYERGSWFEYLLGDGANINSANDNDPRRPYPVDTTTILDFPVYIRFEPVSSNDNWKIYFAAALVYVGDPVQFEGAFYTPLDNDGLWLGQSFGKVLFMPRVPGYEFRELLEEGVRQRGAKLS
jgi:hypothetical protein